MVRGVPASPGDSVVVLLCRTGLKVGEDVLEGGLTIEMVMTPEHQRQESFT